MLRSKSILFALLSLFLFANSALAQTAQPDARELIKSGNAKYAKAKYESAIQDYARVSPAAGETYAQAL
ncbi:MAG TPA: hypothetical protein VK475_00375, partial [Pyrinomonadaceae bacterium]|nr:hypothetical protein [Pyrinomonadaceae bacterium]